MAEKPKIKWKIQFFDREFSKNKEQHRGGYNQGTFYSYADTPGQALDNLQFRWKNATDRSMDRLPALMDSSRFDRYIMRDDGTGQDKHVRDVLEKIKKQQEQKERRNYDKARKQLEEQESRKMIEKHICPNCHIDISDSDVCPECGFDINNPDVNPFRLSNWFERRIRKEAQLLAKKK